MSSLCTILLRILDYEKIFRGLYIVRFPGFQKRFEAVLRPSSVQAVLRQVDPFSKSVLNFYQSKQVCIHFLIFNETRLETRTYQVFFNHFIAKQVYIKEIFIMF